jgi:arylsulfatase A-like enzyme
LVLSTVKKLQLRDRAESCIRSVIIAGVVILLASTGTSRVTHAYIHRLPPGWQPPAASNTWQARPRYVVLLVLDGGLPAYLKLGAFPHIAALMRRGVTYRNAWDGMLESETPTGHATLGTGSLPKRHGIISFSWVTDDNVTEQPTNPIPIQQGQLEQLLHRSGVPSLASLLKHDKRAIVVATSGHKDYAVDSVGGWAADYLMFYAARGQNWTPVAIPRHVPPQSVLQAPGLTAYAPHLAPGDQDSLAVQLALSAFRRLHQTVTIVNLPEFDWPLGHLRGGQADRASAWQLTNRLDRDLVAIEQEYARARVLKQTLFVLTSDHGMVTLNHVVPHELIQNAVQAAGTSLTDYEFHSAGYLWLRDRSRADRVAANIVGLRNATIRAVYYRRFGTYSYVRASPLGPELPSQTDQAYQFLLNTFSGGSAPQVVIFLRENASILGRNQVGWRGDHGGPSWNAEHIPLVLSGPGVRQGASSSYPATLCDVAPTILSLLGVAPRGMDGVTLADALINADAASAASQDRRGAQLEPIVAALRSQSRRDGN